MMSRYASIVLCIFYLSNVLAIRTCKHFGDYYNPFSENCFNNPNAGAKPVDIVRRWGCQAEEYNVTTKDGYIISIVRAYNNISHSTPIVIGHGLAMNSLGFISMFNKTIAYQLCHTGYDVYLINFRGSLFSRGHTNLTQSGYAYWLFSFHEMGIYDIPRTLDLVAQVSGKTKSLYIGYSLGTSAMMAYSSLYPAEANERLVGAIDLAPVANLTNIRSFVKYLVPFWRFPIKPFVRLIWNGIVLPKNEAQDRLCASGPISIYICYFIKSLVFGNAYKLVDLLYRPVTDMNNPDGMSINNVEHYYQCIIAKRFLQFDYGKQENLERYGRETPPDYPISKISIPTAFFVGDNDWLAERHNAVGTYELIPSKSQCGFMVVEDKDFSHDSFITSRYQMSQLGLPVIQKLQQMESGSC